MSIAAQAVHGLKVCVIPNPDNDFRPLALRHRTLSAVMGLLLMAKLVAVSAVALIPAQAELSTITSARITELTNAERKKKGLPPLKVNSLLLSAAQQKAQHMLDKDYFAHISPDGVTPWFWMAKVGYQYEVAGENLAIDFTEAEDVATAWLASPSHRDNMLMAGYAETGVAVATGEFQGGTSTVVVHMFGRAVGQTAAATSSPQTTPTPSPAASPTPVPILAPTPLPIPSDDSPPRVPRIALVGEASTVKQTAEVTIEGEAGSTVRLLVNNQVRSSARLPSSGSTTRTLDLSALPEGLVVLRAYAVDNAGNESEVSAALAITKDTLGPLIDEKALAFALSPTFDAPVVALHVPNSDFSVAGERDGWVMIGEVDTPVSLTLTDEFQNETRLANLSFRPQFLTDIREDELRLPSRAQRFSRRMAGAIAAILAVLLLFTILIRIRIQRPALIAHTAAVIIIATTLFLI